jgi:O-antigen ligase/Tfp pilus assembly protein PilF
MPSKLQKILSLLPRLSLLALIFGMQLVFWQECQDPFSPVELAWIKILLPLGLLPFFAVRWPGFKALLGHWAAKAAAAWIVWLWVCAAFSPDHEAAGKNALEYSLYTLLFFLPALLSIAERRRLLYAFFGACLLATIYGIAQHFDFDPWKWSTNFAGRPLGTMGNPNFFGGHLVLAWGIALGLFVTAAPQKRLRWGLFLAALSLVQFYSWTVGVWLGMAGAAAAVVIWSLSPAGGGLRAKWHIKRSALLLGAGAMLIVVAGAWFASRHELSEGKSASITNRLMMWKVAIKLWQEKPVQGIGLTQYRRRFADTQAGILSSEKGWNYVVTWLPHENFLYLLCETGLIGLALFCAAWALALLRARERLRSLDSEAWAAALGCLGMVGVSLLNTFSNIPPSAAAFWLLLGLLAFPPRRVVPEPGISWLPAVCAAGLVSLVLGYFAGREISAQRMMREGLRKKKTGELQLSASMLEKAAEMNIKEFTPQESVGIWYELGEVLRSGGALPQATDAYAKDLENNPNSPETHNMLGAALGQQGKPAESAIQLREAIRLSPGYGPAMLNLGIAYATNNNLSGAAETWNKLLVLEPDNTDAKKYLAQLSFMKPKK